MTVIILAAGRGTRLEDLTTDKPKALVRLFKKELLAYILDMAKYINADTIIVVGGSRYEFVNKFVNSYTPDAIVINNENYEWGNLYSLLTALNYVEEGFFLFNVDHIFSKALLDNILSLREVSDDIMVVCDRYKPVEDGQMLVHVRDGRLERISKELTLFNTGYTGLTQCPSEALKSFKAACQNVADIRGETAIFEDVLNYMVKDGVRISCPDIGREKWFEVDTKSDLLNAENMIVKNPEIWA